MKERFEYIDALRGLAMFLVVFVHIELFSLFDFNFDTPLALSFRIIHLPLFFFVSGFCALRHSVPSWSNIIKKVRILFLPMLFWGMIYTYFVIHQDVLDFVFHISKLGYWFTLSLLEIFLIYYLLLFVVSKCFPKNNEHYGFYSLLFIVLLFFHFVKVPMLENNQLHILGDVTCLHNTFKYFQYFALGLIVRDFLPHIEQWLFNKYVMAIIFVLYGVGTYINIFNADFLLFPLTICSYIGILFMFIIFKKNRCFIETSFIGKSLQFVGKYTLEIYMLHYFFLPSLPMLGQFFKDNPNVVLEFFSVGLISCLIIFVCLGAAKLIKTSTLLGKWTLGEN